jgi:multiple sugar transport system ATP-binding protein
MSRLVLVRVSKRFVGPAGEGVHALREVSLAVEDGELVVLVGPSGSGKTTLLRLIAGLETPTAGEVLVDGQVVNDRPAQARDVAMVFQHHALYPHLTVRENLALPLKLRRLPRAERDRRVRETAELLDLTPVLERRPAAISGGERQRAALGRALVRQPKLLLLDEPLSDLDTPLRRRLRWEIQQLQARLGVTTLYVTHDQAEATAFGRRLIVLRQGAVQQIGSAQELYDRPANVFVAEFLGPAPMNLFRGRLERRGQQLAFAAEPGAATRSGQALDWTFDADAAAQGSAWAGREVILGLRPDDVTVLGTGTDPASAARLRATVEHSESIGRASYVYCCAAGMRIAAWFASGDPPPPGSEVGLALHLARAHFFDPATGRRLDG